MHLCRSRYFGEIIDAVMNRSEIGKIAKHEWIVTPQIRPFMQIEIDAFVVMPDHIHGIFIIGINPSKPKGSDASRPSQFRPIIPRTGTVIVRKNNPSVLPV